MWVGWGLYNNGELKEGEEEEEMLNYLTLNKLMHIWGIIIQLVIATNAHLGDYFPTGYCHITFNICHIYL